MKGKWKAMSWIPFELLNFVSSEWVAAHTVFIYLTFQKESMHFSAHCLPYILFPREKIQKSSGCLPYPQRCFLPQPGSLWQWCPWWFAKTRQSKGMQTPKTLILAEISQCIQQTPPPLMLVMKLRPREEEWQGWDHKASYKQILDQNSGLFASRKNKTQYEMVAQPTFSPCCALQPAQGLVLTIWYQAHLKEYAFHIGSNDQDMKYEPSFSK